MKSSHVVVLGLAVVAVGGVAAWQLFPSRASEKPLAGPDVRTEAPAIATESAAHAKDARSSPAPAPAADARTPGTPTTRESLAETPASNPVIIGDVASGSLDTVVTDDAAIVAKYANRSQAERKAALTDLRSIVFGETQIPADTKEGRLDAATLASIKAELSWLETHLEP